MTFKKIFNDALNPWDNMTFDALVFSDVHGTMKAINRINASIHKYDPDIAVSCGDITHFGSKEWAVKFLDRITLPVIGVTGNCDPPGIEEAYEECGGSDIHLSTYEKENYTFIGLSGGNNPEEEIEEFRELAERGDVFVLHQPPYSHLDRTGKGKNIGSRELLPIIERSSPLLILSGHVHEAKGVEDDGLTKYVNPGPAADDNLVLVRFKEDEVIPKTI